jgi:hypothetical protein
MRRGDNIVGPRFAYRPSKEKDRLLGGMKNSGNTSVMGPTQAPPMAKHDLRPVL